MTPEPTSGQPPIDERFVRPTRTLRTKPAPAPPPSNVRRPSGSAAASEPAAATAPPPPPARLRSASPADPYAWWRKRTFASPDDEIAAWYKCQESDEMEPPSPWNFELAQAGSQAPQEPATQEGAEPTQAPAVSSAPPGSFNRQGSEQRLHFLWVVEAWMGQSRPTEEQTTDFSRLSDADLIALGKRVAARVHAAYPGDLRDVRTLTTWVLCHEPPEGTGIPDETVEEAVYYAIERAQYAMARAFSDWHSCADGVRTFINAYEELARAPAAPPAPASPGTGKQISRTARKAAAPATVPVDPPAPADEPRPAPDSSGWFVQWRERRGHRGCFGIHPAQNRNGGNTGWITPCYIDGHPARRAIERGQYHWTTDLGEPTRL